MFTDVSFLVNRSAPKDLVRVAKRRYYNRYVAETLSSLLAKFPSIVIFIIEAPVYMYCPTKADGSNLRRKANCATERSNSLGGVF